MILATGLFTISTAITAGTTAPTTTPSVTAPQKTPSAMPNIPAPAPAAPKTTQPPAPAEPAVTPQAEAPVTIEKYTNTEKHYSIQYPSNWKRNDVPKLDFVLFAPQLGEETNTYASMNIVSEKVGPGITLNQFYTESVANLSSALKDVTVDKNGDTLINNIPAKWVLYSHVMQNIKLQVLQYFIVANETVYLLTFSSSADSFQDYQTSFENIADSLHITKPKS